MKVLVLAYYYPPCNSVASERPSSFVKGLLKDKHEVTVITRNWKGNETNWNDYLETIDAGETFRGRNLNIFYLPYKKNVITKKKLFAHYFKGEFSPEAYYYQFKKEVYKIIDKIYPDSIIATSGPLNIIKLAYKIKKEKKIPTFLDFRDFENLYLNKSFQFNTNFFLHKYRLLLLGKYIKFADYIFTISEFHLKKLRKYNKNVEVIFNGFNEDEFKNFSDYSNHKNFTISIIGTLYPQQDIVSMINVFKEFLKNKPNVKINFIGVDPIKSVSKKIKDALPSNNILVTKRLPKADALNYMNNSHILYYIGWKGYKGIYSSKIFEYLGAKKNILIYPSDKDVLNELITHTKSGESLEIHFECLKYLESKYKEWVNSGTLTYNGNLEKIKTFSRENQYSKISNIITKN